MQHDFFRHPRNYQRLSSRILGFPSTTLVSYFSFDVLLSTSTLCRIHFTPSVDSPALPNDSRQGIFLPGVLTKNGVNPRRYFTAIFATVTEKICACHERSWCMQGSIRVAIILATPQLSELYESVLSELCMTWDLKSRPQMPLPPSKKY
ncbi:hypothetical protein EVAR_101289_1 [Eumeta japonica]|uniref:Uncharacterized protein n=1 Tax=Eumeta variegata TaxID=151549 RepID=A0A4C1SGF6_EUMVA|nr:hypothetical protein EVAR_101289_1 [Eumeta japonica]